MLIKDIYGNWRNPDYKWAVEARITYPTSPSRIDRDFVYWFTWKKYKSQRAMLQALKHFKDNKESGSFFNGRMSNDGGKTWHESHWHFRPVHYNIDTEKFVRLPKIKQSKPKKTSIIQLLKRIFKIKK